MIMFFCTNVIPSGQCLKLIFKKKIHCACLVKGPKSKLVRMLKMIFKSVLFRSLEISLIP